jgi:hypothetical protein
MFGYSWRVWEEKFGDTPEVIAVSAKKILRLAEKDADYALYSQDHNLKRQFYWRDENTESGWEKVTLSWVCDKAYPGNNF